MDGYQNYRGGYGYTGLLPIVRELRQKQTSAEQIFWELVRDRRFRQAKFRRQHQIGLYVADFYCHEYHLVIELDGEVHDQKINRKFDKLRDEYMRSLGLVVIRIPNDLLLNAPDRVFAEIASVMDKDSR